MEEDKGKVRSDLALTLMGSAQERSHEGVQHRVSSCRLTEAQRQRLHRLFEILGDVQALRRKAMLELDTPAKQLVDDMASVQVPPSAASQRVAQEWCKRLCKHRDLFSQTILCIASPSQKRFYYFMYVVKSPQDVVLAPLKVRDLSSEASGSVCRAIDVPFVVHSA